MLHSDDIFKAAKAEGPGNETRLSNTYCCGKWAFEIVLQILITPIDFSSLEKKMLRATFLVSAEHTYVSLVSEFKFCQIDSF